MRFIASSRDGPTVIRQPRRSRAGSLELATTHDLGDRRTQMMHGADGNGGGHGANVPGYLEVRRCPPAAGAFVLHFAAKRRVSSSLSADSSRCPDCPSNAIRARSLRPGRTDKADKQDPTTPPIVFVDPPQESARPSAQARRVFCCGRRFNTEPSDALPSPALPPSAMYGTPPSANCWCSAP
jgi:hypothetical protein